jgi:acyl carrier protein
MADELVASSTGSLEQVVARRLAHLHDGERVDRAAIDCDASFFAPTGFYVGDDVLDSLDIVEMIVALEVDFHVDIVMAHDVTQYDSIAKLSRLLEQIAGATELAAFESHWGGDIERGISEDVNDVL